MTRQEAIALVREVSNYMATRPEIDEAIDMAIEALDQEETLQNLKKPNKSDLIVKGAGEIKDGLYNIKDGKLFKYKANGGTVRTYPIVSADRPTGHWIDDEKQNVLMRKFIEKGEVWRVCSVCGAGLMIGAEYETDKYYHETFHNYCPNCGADMKGGEEE